MKIVYKIENGGIAIITPVIDGNLTLEQIAFKDVPFEKPFKIVDDNEVPADRTFRAAWEIDMTDPDGYGADYGVGSNNEVIGWNEDGTPITKRIS